MKAEDARKLSESFDHAMKLEREAERKRNAEAEEVLKVGAARDAEELLAIAMAAIEVEAKKGNRSFRFDCSQLNSYARPHVINLLSQDGFEAKYGERWHEPAYDEGHDYGSYWSRWFDITW